MLKMTLLFIFNFFIITNYPFLKKTISRSLTKNNIIKLKMTAPYLNNYRLLYLQNNKEEVPTVYLDDKKIELRCDNVECKLNSGDYSISAIYKLEWDTKLHNLNTMFMYVNLYSIDFSEFDSSEVTDMKGMISSCEYIKTINLTGLDTSNVNNMGNMFSGCKELTSLINFNSLDTSNVKNMRMIFRDCRRLKSINFNGLITSNVEDMSYMFYGCSLLTTINVDNLDTSNVKDMSYMFCICSSLTTINLNNFDISNVNNTNSMFAGCSRLNNLDISNFNVKNIKNSGYMFEGCSSLQNLKFNLSNSQVKTAEYMFSECTSLEYLTFNFITPNSLNMKYMFSGCISLKYIHLNINTPELLDMQRMFQNCQDLIYLNINNIIITNTMDISDFSSNSFIPLNVGNMDFMFYSCSSLTSISFNNFYATNVTTSQSMFEDCLSLKYLNASSFKKSKVENMKSMFKNCNSLVFLDLRNFNVPQAKNMNELFNGCSSLKELNIGNFQTNSVIDMSYMFYGCSSLSTLNLSQLITSNVTNMYGMFYQCFSLESLNLNNFQTSNVINMGNLFSYCTSLTSVLFDNFDTGKVTNLNAMFMGCTSLLSLNLSHFILAPNVDMINMFSSCLNLKYINLFNFNITSNMKSDTMFIGLSDNLVYCIKENSLNSIYFKDLTSKECSTNDCSEDWRKSIKKYIKEKNKCVNNCSEDENYKFEFENECYKKCPKGTFRLSKKEFICLEYEEKEIESTELNAENIGSFSENTDLNVNNTELFIGNTELFIENTELFIKNSQTTIELVGEQKDIYEEKINTNIFCNENFPYLNKVDNKCVKNCEISLFFNYKCIKNITDKNIYKNNFIFIVNEISDNSEANFLSNITKYNIDYTIKENNLIYQLTTTFNQNIDNKNTNISIVNLGICEDYLKEFYNIDKNLSLLIFKLEYYINDYKIPIIKFELFHPITKERLDYHICNNSLINFYIPVDINEDEIYLYNKNDKYYNDKCFPVESKNGTDITVYNRRKFFNDKYLSLCQKNCEFISYNSTSKKALCQCTFKENEDIELDDIINKKKLLNNFKDLRASSNIDIILCYKILFSKNGIIYNIGNYILSFIIIFFFVSIILFYLRERILLMNKIKYIENIKKNNIQTKVTSVSKAIPIKNIKKVKEANLIKKNKNKNKKKRKIKNKENSSSLLRFNKSNNNIINNNKNKNKNTIDTLNNYVDFEINSFSYEKASKLDRRTYFQYYISLLKVNHSLIFSFYLSNDYNSKIIKICLFLFSFSVFYCINALFFNDKTMNKIYEDEGIFNFVYFLPQMIYSTIISVTINSIIRFLSLTEKNIIEIKNNKNEKKTEKIKKCLKIKFILFFSLSLLFLFVFWYYISCFCAVYKKTQLYLLKDTLISFSLSMVYPFIIYLIPGLCRIPSLKYPKFCYIISTFAQKI